MSKALPTIQEEDETKQKSLFPPEPTSTSFLPQTINQSSASAVQIPKPPSRLSNRSQTSQGRALLSNIIINDENAVKVTPKKRAIITHAKINNITLTEDCFGIYTVRASQQINIQRFTWTSTDKTSVQIITYGARVLSIKLPDKRGIVDDVVLGFGDLAGYLHYHNFKFGATIGRVTNKIANASFELDDTSYKVSANQDVHYADGGFTGLDKAVWDSYVNGTKVILTYASPHDDEGFPGSVMVTITYELTPTNEFCIDMEAKTTKPTIINLSNLCYFNLGGHHSGPEGIYKHSVLINANCYTLMDDNHLPTGKIMNVVNTKYDFTTAKLLKDYLDIEPDSGYDQNLCINRAVAQGNCFVARAIHVGNGRVLEVYSNQRGVRFETANSLGLGVVSLARSLSSLDNTNDEFLGGVLNSAGIFVLLNMLYETMNSIKEFDETNFTVVHQLMKQLCAIPISIRKPRKRNRMSFANPDFCLRGFLNVLEMSLMQVRTIMPDDVDEITSWTELKLVVDDMLQRYADMDNPDSLQSDMFEEQTEMDEDQVKMESSIDNRGENTKQTNGEMPKTLKSSSKSLPSGEKLKKSPSNASHTSAKIQKSVSIDPSNQTRQAASNSKENIYDRGPVSFISASFLRSRTSSILKEAEMTNVALTSHDNVIPSAYKDGRVHGKNNAIYKRSGGIVFQTQNYPDAIHHDNFPSPILRPGQTYKHSIVYKFWVKRDDLKKLRPKKRCR